MAKIALLIGVSDYEGGLASLPGTQVDIQEMQRVLQKPQVAGFDVVELLVNPDPTQMQFAIEKLFLENRSRDDLILLYFSGHGVKDDNGRLYFATRITQKNQQGRVFTSTAVPASFIQNCMSSFNSHSKRQVLILDCCFSGVFANDMKAKQAEEEVVDIKAQLGGEGRAVLTSSTSTQVSYEKEGAGIYTRYLVQGLETGAADRNGDGQISVDELHEYAKEKVQEAAPSMQPEIYAVKEGYKILLAQAPQGDANLTYRKELDARAKQKRGQLSLIDQRALRLRWQQLGISPQEAEQIAREVLRPYDEFWTKMQEFEQAIQEALCYEPPFRSNALDDLRYLQQVLQLRDEDIASTLQNYGLYSYLEQSQQLATRLEAASLAKARLAAQLPELEEDLSSEQGVDYTRLRDLLKAGDWKEADQETYRIMIRSVGRQEGDWFTVESICNFPCHDLKKIDSLWLKYSNGKFGFSVQKQIFLECGGKLDVDSTFTLPTNSNVWYKFCNCIGWHISNELVSNSKFIFDNTQAPPGHLPMAGVFWGGGEIRGGVGWRDGQGISAMVKRLARCEMLGL